MGVNCEGKKIVLAIKSTKNDMKPIKMIHNANVKSVKAVAKEVNPFFLCVNGIGNKRIIPSLL